jgi:Flp pilus assembly protein TadG
VDAAALAGAQALPDDPAQAQALASEYLAKNGGVAATVTIQSQLTGAGPGAFRLLSARAVSLVD